MTEAPPAGDHRNNMPMLISSIAKDKKVIHKKEKDGTIKKVFVVRFDYFYFSTIKSGA